MNFTTKAALYILLDDWDKKKAAEQEVAAKRRMTQETRHELSTRRELEVARHELSSMAERERHEQVPTAPGSDDDEPRGEAAQNFIDDWPYPFFPESLPTRPTPEPYFAPDPEDETERNYFAPD
jgi:hypothetical protein